MAEQLDPNFETELRNTNSLGLEEPNMKEAERQPDIWLQFQKTDHKFTVSRTGAYGGGAAGIRISLGDWYEVSTKLERAGFSAERISILKERLEDHAVAIVGPVSMTVEELAALGIQQAA